ncbi:hypothetical protein F2Q70_00017486 [Brassica cretica]|uniref:Uncharacterized protein n=1 Tax=Brassica cretica TaxID=69181 RepID=A0A8S9I614_BRACR|nr:hypothetical protein F2Q70_00017486 [Brassica cretica]
MLDSVFCETTLTALPVITRASSWGISSLATLCLGKVIISTSCIISSKGATPGSLVACRENDGQGLDFGLPLIARFRHRTRGITYALKSTGVAHFQQAFPRQDIAPGNFLEADSEAVPIPPLRRRRSCFFDDGPRSRIREGDLANMRRKNAIHPSVGMRSPTDIERAPDGGASEIAIYEAYLEAGFRGVIPSLIGEVSSFFVGFYHLQFRDGTPLVEEPSRGIRGTTPSEMTRAINVSHPVSFPGEAVVVGVKIGHDGIDIRKSFSVKTSKAEKTNSRNGSPGEFGRDTGQLARRSRPCCRSSRRRARP